MKRILWRIYWVLGGACGLGLIVVLFNYSIYGLIPVAGVIILGLIGGIVLMRTKTTSGAEK